MRILDPLPGLGRTVIGGFESTHLPAYGVDGLDLTGHAGRWRSDIDALLASGVRCLRYPLRWPKIEPTSGEFDWQETDQVLGYLHDAGAVPIVDLVHHTSYPGWLTGGFADPGFSAAFLRYTAAVATRYPWIAAYTVFNEPFATLFLAGHEGIWPPYDRGMTGFVGLLNSVLPAVSEAARCWAELLPAAHHVWVDTAEYHTGSGSGEEHARVANDRRHVVLDLVMSYDLDPKRPFLKSLLAAGGERLLDLPPARVDVLGLDYYCHSEWFYDDRRGYAPSPHPAGFATIAEQYWHRYGLPMMLTETNLRGLPTDRLSWLRHTLEEYELALSRGVPLHGYCWFPQIDSCDWDSLLARCARRVDPVGVLSLNLDGNRSGSVFTEFWHAAAAGAAVASLPAYRFQQPCATQLAGLLPAMSHWPWQDPPEGETIPPVVVGTPADQKGSLPMSLTSARPDLVVLSHLRWTWVWQRPQHLVSRLSRLRAHDGSRTWFVEEPVSGDVDHPQLRTAECDGVVRIWLVVPTVPGQPEFLGFDDPAAAGYGGLVAQLLAERGRPAAPDVWLYTPMAFDLAQSLQGGRLIYDVMDDLSAFHNASAGMSLRQRRALAEADVVFTGGRSLHQGVMGQRRRDVHLFPSGVDRAHYASSRALRQTRDGVDRAHYASSRALRQTRATPVAGYVGVIDERIDLSLLAQLADQLPDWTVRVVGPVAKIDAAILPRAANIEYMGFTPYEQLPTVMAGFDVALMPFALNEATRSISPTKTLEYLAAGLPVVSTRVPDVVVDYGTVVHLADDANEFAAGCRRVLMDDPTSRDRRVAPLLARQEWDGIAVSMDTLLGSTATPALAASEENQEQSA